VCSDTDARCGGNQECLVDQQRMAGQSKQTLDHVRGVHIGGQGDAQQHRQRHHRDRHHLPHQQHGPEAVHDRMSSLVFQQQQQRRWLGRADQVGQIRMGAGQQGKPVNRCGRRRGFHCSIGS
jgi:hypothetical protein